MSDPFADRLSAYLDGELTGRERGEMESHLATCKSCSATLLELQAVVQEAGSLADRPPAADFWPEISRRIASQPRAVPDPDAGRGRRVSRTLTFSIPGALAAGLALILTTAAITYMIVPSPGTATPPRPGDGLAPESVVRTAGATGSGRGAADLAGHVSRAGDAPQAAALPAARHLPGESARLKLDAAIVDLTRLLEERRDRFHPHTLRMIEMKLDAVDRAIDDARRALADSPTDPYLYRHLHQTLQMKMALLRQAAGAAQAAS
jgi:hypothetical protein